MTIKVFGFKPYVVITESMEPVINVNDMVVVRQFDMDEAEVGDIITFNADIDYNGTQEVVTHYIYSITDDNGTTIIRTNRYFDEDATPIPDTWLLTEDDVLGAYWFQIPKLGFLVQFLKSPFGIAAILVNAGVITAIVLLLKKGKDQTAPTEETPTK
jgi:signal peptidase